MRESLRKGPRGGELGSSICALSVLARPRLLFQDEEKTDGPKGEDVDRREARCGIEPARSLESNAAVEDADMSWIDIFESAGVAVPDLNGLVTGVARKLFCDELLG